MGLEQEDVMMDRKDGRAPKVGEESPRVGGTFDKVIVNIDCLLEKHIVCLKKGITNLQQ